MKKLSSTVIKSGKTDNGNWALVEVNIEEFPVRALINTKELIEVGVVLEVPELVIKVSLNRDS